MSYKLLFLPSAKKEAHQLFNSKTKFYLNDEQWEGFCKALEKDPKDNKALQKLLNSKSVFDE